MKPLVRLLVSVAIVGLFVGAPLLALGPFHASPGAPQAAEFAASATPPPTSRGSVFTCPLPPPPYPYYDQENGVWPIVPSQRYQGTCGYMAADEVHATYGSSHPYSAERFAQSLTLPKDGTQSQSNAYAQFWLGTVVKGDTFSQWDQSFAGVWFVPQGSGPSLTYSASVHVFSLVNANFYPGGVCPLSNLTWNSSFFCEKDDYNPVGSVNGTETINAGDQLTVTFWGDRAATDGLNIWLNDSTTSSKSLHYQLNSTNSGTYTFEPFFNASCVDACVLNWSMNMGEGIAFLLCPIFPTGFAVCDSYNQTIWGGTDPPQFSIPHFYPPGLAAGDFYYFSPASDSGVCNSVTGITTYCFNNFDFGGDGSYPWFTYNGSELDFGTNWTWTTQNWGGPNGELLSTGNPNDIVPFYFFRTSNDSREGFLAPGHGLNVTAWVQDLGSITSVSLNYRINGGTAASLPMTFVNGTPSSANFTVELPPGPDGMVNFTINATNHAGATIVQPFLGVYHVQRGPLPTFHVAVQVPYPSCAGAVVNGTLYAPGSSAPLAPGDYPVIAQGCYPYVFSSWSSTPGIRLANVSALATTLEVSASGNLTAHWQYVRPPDSLTVFTNPSTCGQVIVNGSYYGNNQVVAPALFDQRNYTLSYLGCSGEQFAGWSFTGNLSILGGTNNVWNLEPFSNGTVTANFVATSSGNAVVFYTNPSTCGGVAIRGVGYVSGSSISLAAGTYPIAPDPCYHFGFLPPWVTTGGLSISGNNLTVSNGGTITENYYVLTIVTIAILGCGTAYWDTSVVSDGESIVVANNSTHVVAGTACPGWYLYAISGTGGIAVVGSVATVTGSGTVYYTFIKGAATQAVVFLTDPTSCGAIIFNGAAFYNSNYTFVPPGTVATLTPAPCAGYGFLSWVAYGQITILGDTAWLNGTGAIQAVFQPLATLYLYTSPTGCGSVSLANTSYASGSAVSLTEFKLYSLAAVPCAGYGFSGWVNTTGAQLPLGTNVGSQSVFLSSSGVLTAIFAPVYFTVIVEVTPANCGGVRVAGQTVGNGTLLSFLAGTYPVTPAPCGGWQLLRWQLTGGVAVANTTLYVNGSGNVTAVYEPIPPVIAISVPADAFIGVAVVLGATVAVPVPPYNYTYAWSFGDGTSASTTVDFTSHKYAATGSYQVSVVVTDPYGRVANASGTVTVVAAATATTSGFSTEALAVIGVAAIVVLAVAVIGLRIRRGPSEDRPVGAGPAPPPPEPMDAPEAPSFSALDGEPPKP